MRVQPLGPLSATAATPWRLHIALDAPARVPLLRVRTLTAQPPLPVRRSRTGRHQTAVERAVQHLRSAGPGQVCTVIGLSRVDLAPAARASIGGHRAGASELGVARLDGAASATATRCGATDPALAAIDTPMLISAAVSRPQVRLDAFPVAGRGRRAEAGTNLGSFRGIGFWAPRKRSAWGPEAASGDSEAGFAVSGASRAGCAKARTAAAEVAIVGCDDSAVALWAGRELVGVPLHAVAARERASRRAAPATELVVRESSGGVPTGKS